MLTRLVYALLACWFALTAVACATPKPATETATATAVPPTHTPPPTAAPTPTLTAAELRDLRATAVLTTLPGYDPAQHDALLPLARALWGDEHELDPADVTLVAGETAVQITAGAAYPPGALFVWTGEEALLLLPAAPEHAIRRAEATLNGQTLLVWGEYDENGRLLRFADLESRQWITPLDLTEAGDYSLFVTHPSPPTARAATAPSGGPTAGSRWNSPPAPKPACR
jgi:hypothetical protein